MSIFIMKMNNVFCSILLFLFATNNFHVVSKSLCPQVPTCDCSLNTQRYDIFCRPVRNLSVVEELLHTQFANKIINKLMLRNCSVTILPNNSFENSSIVIFMPSCPFETVEEYALSSVINMTKVIFSESVFPRIPPGLRNLSNLKTLNIWFHKLERIEDELMNLTSLLFLSIKQGSLEYVSKDAFVYTPGIVYLDLSYNELNFLDPDILQPLKQLQHVTLRGNQLSTADGLLRNKNPQIVDFYDNNFTTVENVFHENMWAVQSVNIGKNPINFVNASAFAHKLNNLKILEMTMSRYTEVDPLLLQSFRLLEYIDLYNNLLTTIPKEFFSNLLSLNQVVLANNNITSIEGLFHNNLQLESLLLSGNRIPNIVNAFKNLPKLWKLMLSNNYIKGIYNGDLATVPKLKKLILSHNVIVRLDSQCFSELTSLNVLEMSSNKFITFNNSVQHLLTLQELSAKSGRLEIIGDNELVGLPKLTKVNVVYNHIKSVNGAFRQLVSLSELNIAKNKLQTLSRDTFPEKIKIERLEMGGGNPWTCDCRLLWFVEWLKTNKSILVDVPLCHAPGRLRLIPLQNLTVENVTIWPENCPNPCECDCQPQGRDFYVRVDCSNKNLDRIPETLPDYLGELNFRNNSLTNISSLNANLSTHLQIMKLEYNFLINVDFEVPDTLTVLLLEGNELRRFPKHLMHNYSLTEMTLSLNPWICDCDTVPFKKWLLSEDIVLDVNETRCGDTAENNVKLRNRIIVNLNDTELCPSVIGLYVSIAIGSLAVLLVATSMFLAYSRYHLNLKVWMYAHGLTWVKEEDLDTDKMFDALLSYSPLDRDLAIGFITPGLENVEPAFNLFIPERNLLAGGNETVNNVTAVTLCKRIIVILSENFLKDKTCMEIFRTAFAVSVEDKVHRIIIIKYGVLPTVPDMDQALKTVIESTNCLEWGERLFWEKLRFAMPKLKKVRSENTPECITNTGSSGDESSQPLIL